MFKWLAHYTELERLPQFEETGVEHLFKEIDQDKLTVFSIWGDNGTIIAVDLRNGMFRVGNPTQSFMDYTVKDLSNKEEKYRLIYFKRVQRDIGTAPGMTGESIEYFIGYQITIDGKNRKAIMSVNQAEPLKVNITVE